MIIDLHWLELHPKETREFNIQAAPQELSVDTSETRLVKPVDVDLSITNTGRLMVGTGRIIATLEFDCGRCLKPYQRDYEIPFDIELCSDKNIHHFVGEENFIFYHSNEPQVDIRPVIEENIVLALPIRPLCSEECRGLCPNCGRELDQGPCNCQPKETDPRWDALKKLL